jgi:hypothetical protein
MTYTKKKCSALFSVLILLFCMMYIPCRLSAEWGKVILEPEKETESEATTETDPSSESESATKTKNSRDNEKPLTFLLFLNCRANTGDWMPGTGFGFYIIPEYLTSVRISGFMRIDKKTVFVKKSENRYYQLKESRYGFDIVADYTFLLFKGDYSPVNFGLYFAGGVGFTNGSYSGVDIESKTQYSPVIKAGFQLGRQWYARCGYQYFKVPDVPYNHLTFELGCSI